MTTGCFWLRSESWTVPDLSSLVSVKSGAGSPTCRVPPRAWFHRVSKGSTRKTGHGMCFMTEPNFSGGWFMAQKINPTKIIQTTSNVATTRLVIFHARGLGRQRRFAGLAGVLGTVLMNLVAPCASVVRIALHLSRGLRFDLADHNSRRATTHKDLPGHRHFLSSEGKQFVILAAGRRSVRDRPVDRPTRRQDHQRR